MHKYRHKSTNCCIPYSLLLLVVCNVMSRVWLCRLSARRSVPRAAPVPFESCSALICVVRGVRRHYISCRVVVIYVNDDAHAVCALAPVSVGDWTNYDGITYRYRAAGTVERAPRERRVAVARV